MSMAIKNVKDFRTAWRDAKKVIKALPDEEFTPQAPGVPKREMLGAVDAFVSLATTVAASPRGISGVRGAVRKYAGMIFRRRIETMLQAAKKVTSGDHTGINEIWNQVLYAQGSLMLLLRFKEDARDEAVASLAQEQASVLSEHTNLAKVISDLTPRVARMVESAAASIESLDAATERSNDSVSKLELWIEATRETTQAKNKTLIDASTESERHASECVQATKTAAAEAESSRKVAEEIVKEVSGLREELTRLKETADGSHSKVAEYEQQLEETSSRATGLLSSHGVKCEEQLNGWRSKFRKELSSRNSEYATTHKRIEQLLPGAGSVALAEDFQKQATAYDAGKKTYYTAFVAAIAALVAVQIGLLFVTFGSWQEAVLNRMVLGVALGWLALFMQKSFRDHSRIGEDYAFKAARARTYEGYRRAAQEVDQSGELGLQLLSNTLLVIFQHPHDVVAPGDDNNTPVHEGASKISGALKKLASAYKRLRERKDAVAKEILEEVVDEVADVVDDLPAG